MAAQFLFLPCTVPGNNTARKATIDHAGRAPMHVDQATSAVFLLRRVNRRRNACR